MNRDYLIEIPPHKWIGLNVESARDGDVQGRIIAKSKLHTVVTIETIFGDELKCKSNILALSAEQDEPEVIAFSPAYASTYSLCIDLLPSLVQEQIPESWPYLKDIPPNEWIGKFVMSTVDRRIRGQLINKSPSNNAGTIKTSSGGILHIWIKYFVVVGELLTPFFARSLTHSFSYIRRASSRRG